MRIDAALVATGSVGLAAEITWADVRDSDLRLDEVEAALGINVDRRGDEDWALCPLPTHTGDRSDPHFSINNESFLWKCYSCGGGGGLVSLVEQVNGMDRQEAVNWLAQFSEVDSASADVEHKLKRYLGYLHRTDDWVWEKKPTLPWMPPHMLDQFHDDVMLGADLLQFAFHKWGVGPDTVDEFQIGCKREYVHKRRLQGDAIIIPHFWDGNLVGWQARWFDTDSVQVLFGGGKVPKYVNTDDFPKEFTLYNWERALEYRGQPLIVVESFATVMKLHQSGYPAAVGTFGASVSEHQTKLLGSWDGPVMLAYDNDQAGESAIRTISEALRKRVPVWIIPSPEGEKADLGDCDEAEIDRLIAQAEPLQRTRNR